MNKKLGYIGQAGTGKTTKLIHDLEVYLKSIDWLPNNRILALTFMHGSRKRLISKLINLRDKGVKVECMTIDSFATYLFQRFRKKLGLNKIVTIHHENSDKPFIQEREFDVVVNISFIRLKVCQLLNSIHIIDCIKNAYPIIIVDEFQDCESDLLEIVKCLSKSESIFLAADDFQNLNSNTHDCKATSWLKENLEIIYLEKIWRTSNSKILSAASALRKNNRIQEQGILIESIPNPALAAFKISAQIQWKKWGLKNTGSNIALIAPVRPSSSLYVREILERLKLPFQKKDWKLNGN